MPSSLPARLKNAYWVVRHGESEANAKGVIAGSSLSNVERNCLTKVGSEQVNRRFLEALEIHPRAERNWVVYCSPLCRTRQTGRIVADLVHSELMTDIRLIERGFGEYEGGSTSNYSLVWDRDEKSLPVNEYGVEELDQVARRVSAFIWEMESKYQEWNIVACTHGDVASVLIALFKCELLALHRMVGALDTAEVFFFASEQSA